MTTSRTMHVVGLALTATILVASTAGCTARAPSTTPVASSGVPSVTMTFPADAPQTYEAAAKSADALLLSVDEIPGGNWQKGGPVATDDFPMTICGVDNEPQHPAGSFISRKTHPTGAILFQVIRPVGATQAAATVTEMTQALETCISDKRILDGQTASYAMARVPLSDPAVVAYRQNRSDIDQAMWSYVVYLTARDCLVVFIAFRPSPEAPTAFLDSLVVAVRKKG